MAGNPNISLGRINKLSGSVKFQDFPELNIGPSNLMKSGIVFAPQGNTVTQVEAATGIVQVPEPYVMVQVTLNLIRTQPVCQSFRKQIELDSVIGNVDIYPDVDSRAANSGLLSKYSLKNCAIMTFDGLDFNSGSATYNVHITGSYDVNSTLWP